MSQIQNVRVLAGAIPFTANNVNDTYRGMVLLADGSRKHGIIKDLNLQQLTNELLAAVLGRELGLPVPDAFLGVVPTGVLPVKQLGLSDGTGHLVFVSADVATPNLAQQYKFGGSAVTDVLVQHLKDWLNLGGLYAFDAWIANVDRHPGNLLIDGPTNIYLIDHGHAFTGPTWKPSNLNPITEYKSVLADWLTGVLSPTQKTQKGNDAGTFTTKIAALNVPKALIDGLTDKLLPSGYDVALRDFLVNRIQYVPNHARKALGVPMLAP